MGIKRFVRCIIAIILIAFALFTFLSFLSYSSNDPPFADYPINNPIKNFCGIAGAKVAGYAIAGMGRTSYLIVIMIGWLGVQYLCKERIEYLWVRAIGAVLLLFSVASLLTFGCYLFKKDFLSANVGGIFGIVIVSRLYEYFNLTGTFIILGLGFVISVMLLLNSTPISPFLKIPKGKKVNSTPVRESVAKGANTLPHSKVNTPDDSDILVDDPIEDHANAYPASDIMETEDEPCESADKLEKVREEYGGEQYPEDVGSYDTDPGKKNDDAYRLPPSDLLEKPVFKEYADDWDQITQRAQVLKNTLEQFNVKSEVVEIERGPVITMYELELAPGTKVGKVVGLSDDLAIALKAPSVRVVAPLMGKSSIGLEVPNIQRKMVMLRELLDASEEVRKKMAIPLLIGKDVAGNPVISDLASMPHLLIAGTTGSGKSVCLNSVILSILFLRHPSDVQLLLVDPKMVEFSLFREIPHLISPVVTDMKKAAAVLEWAVNKMEERYALLASVGVKHINGYNRLGMSEIKRRLNPDGDANLEDVSFYLPHIVIVVDELADLMMVASKEVEASVIRLSQKSRAVGIHLILATQRPSVDVITGLIKSNLPSRISFYVASKVDSRTILDQNGAEKLLGSGDMLFLPPGTSKLVRVQGAYVSDEEVKNAVEYLRKCAAPKFSPELKCWKGASDRENNAKDNLYNEAVRIILETQRGSVSLLQRRLEIGYSRAAKLIDLMAEDGIVGEYKGSQAREVFLTLEDWDAQMARMNQEEMDNA
ncbi:MAG: DNA translocase FtsK [Candidatus Brocadia sp. AMX2]|uniref:DNA segregation ATPase FtsK/SpoIIIE S-DNA-T family n=1 Tax=Candidatus Brocadia sinica JPN1 TaxID=1197129 RepID=A0ABQ0K0L6_9BACT|nr:MULTISPECIES: DNA translocase FtsK [Brocadia]MBC6932712.1 DNA translocase FtsK [Candidatus Brocadia sp.]MBL1169962.1 DNA translocase FtsK [Candidatus Brocadia sp. AMX1]MCK6469574.1 DNA translocase FtsK [Candidatus Brocadia sinica]NOG42366.1 DNA translocase FtsK [Planctomycetota bacterium]KAA0243180.1 MAG: DNA translocase FtsK [Candidatus Brocadia sp. AMX2]